MTTTDDRTIFERMAHSRYWLFWSTAVPMAITITGFAWADEVLKARAEAAELRTKLTACEARSP